MCSATSEPSPINVLESASPCSMTDLEEHATWQVGVVLPPGQVGPDTGIEEVRVHCLGHTRHGLCHGLDAATRVAQAAGGEAMGVGVEGGRHIATQDTGTRTARLHKQGKMKHSREAGWRQPTLSTQGRTVSSDATAGPPSASISRVMRLKENSSACPVKDTLVRSSLARSTACRPQQTRRDTWAFHTR